MDNKLKLISKTIEEYKKRSEWLDSIPCDISSAFFDNAYVSSLEKLNETLLQEILGETLYQELTWFLYDKPQGKSSITFSDGVVFDVDTPEDFLNYLSVVYIK